MIARVRKYQILHYLFAGVLFLLIGIYVNQSIKITGLYMDDLYLWSCFGETSLLSFLFPVGSQRFRFVFNILAYIVLKLTGANIHLIVMVNIVLNALVALWLFYLTKYISKSFGIGYLIGAIYMVSHFSYYQIGQLYGLLETFSLFGVLVMLYFLYHYLNDKENKGFSPFIIATVVYFSTTFIHERYLVLLVPLVMTVILKSIMNQSIKREWRLIPIALAVFGLILTIRFWAIGSLSLAGTGGTNVSDTFSATSALRFSLDQVLYLLGVHAGPEYLNGIAWNQIPIVIKCIIVVEIIAMMAIFLLYFGELFRFKEERRQNICNSILFLTFMAMCIGASSVTIRLELRWVYVAFTLMLCYLAFIYQKIVKTKQKRIKLIFFLSLYCCCFLPVELFYRSHYSNIYFWNNQQRYNSLAEVTYGTYKQEMFEKTIYIVGNHFTIDSFTANTFFKPYNPGWKFPNPEIQFVKDIDEFGLVNNLMIILAEDVKNNRYIDVTSFVKEMKCDISYGYYEDRWMDQQSKLSVMAGQSGEIHLTGIFPGNAIGTEEVRIVINGEQEIKSSLNGNEIDITIKATPSHKIDLDIFMNFYMIDALEQRGEYPLSALVEIKSE